MCNGTIEERRVQHSDGEAFIPGNEIQETFDGRHSLAKLICWRWMSPSCETEDENYTSKLRDLNEISFVNYINVVF